MEGYKCLSNGKECIEVNSCDSVNDTSYETNSTELKKLCDLFDNCEPYENRCKTKYIPTTIVTTIPNIVTTLPTTTVPITILTNIPSIISTTMSSSILTTEPTTIIKTVATTIQIKEPNTILTTKPTTTSTKEPDTTQTTDLGTTSITSPTTKLTTTTSLNTTPTTSNTTTSTKTPTTIPSTIPNLIHNTITTNIPTNVPYINNTNIPTTMPNLIPTIITSNIQKNIPTNIPYINTTNIPATIPNLILNSIPTTAPAELPKTIPTTMHTNIPRIIPTTIANTELMIPNTTVVENLTSHEPVPAIFLGLSNFKMDPSYYSFHIYLTPIKNGIYSQTSNFKGIIDYYTNMRVLKETEGNCTLQDATNLKYRYYCIDYEDTENIKSIKILPDFAFVNQDIDIIGVSPIAKTLIDNLLLYDERYDEKYDQLYNSTIYLMDNSTYQTNGKLSFNITGRINGTQPKFENKDISLIVSLQSGQKTEANLDCVINNIYLEYYELNCKSNETLLINLQGAISFIDNDGLLVFNFIDGNDAIIELKNINSYNKLILSKHTALNPGAIATIIIVLVVVVAVLIFLAIYFRKKEKKEINWNSSSIIKLKN